MRAFSAVAELLVNFGGNIASIEYRISRTGSQEVKG